MKTTDKIVLNVLEKINSRSIVGIKKYGTTLKDNSKDDFLTHLQEELMDAILYIEKLKQKDAPIKDKEPVKKINLFQYESLLDIVSLNQLVSDEGLQEKTSKRETVYKRMIVASELLLTNPAISPSTVGKLIGRKDSSMVYYYQKKYKSYLNYPDFLIIRRQLIYKLSLLRLNIKNNGIELDSWI